jgi:hypothetical protein
MSNGPMNATISLKKATDWSGYVPLADIFIDWVDWWMCDMRSLSTLDQGDMACLEVKSNWIIFVVG